MDKIYQIIFATAATGITGFILWMLQRSFTNIGRTLEKQNDSFQEGFNVLNAHITETNENILKYKLDASESFAKAVPNTTAHEKIWITFGEIKERLIKLEIRKEDEERNQESSG